MRPAELGMAVVMAAFSIYLMYLAQLPPLEIGWVPKKGPGSGAFPFWLSLGMLVCSLVIFVRGLAGKTPQSRSAKPFIDKEALLLLSKAAGAIFMMLLITHWLGAYVAIFLFLLVFVGHIGRHGVFTTLAIALATPIGIFLFFEGGMKILLPKGLTEPVFLPLYKIFVY